MADSQFDQFLQEATCQHPQPDAALDRDAFYGLYTSWCFVSQSTPQAEPVFWKAMKQRLRPGNKLRMTGPAAADYLLNSYQAVV